MFSQHSKGQKGMDDDMQSVHGPEAARLVEQHPAQQQEHNQQWYATLMDQGASAGEYSAGGGTQSLEQDLPSLHSDLPVSPPRTHHIYHDIHDTYICQIFDS